jgi:hypothetical protein
MSRKREVKNEIKKLEKLMKTISSLRSALQLMIREAPGIQKVVLILGGSPLRPQNAYELLFTQRRDHVLGYEGDFAKSKAAEALSKKTIRALISTGAGSTSYPGPMRLFILVHAPPTLNLPQHFLPKRDFRYNRKVYTSLLILFHTSMYNIPIFRHLQTSFIIAVCAFKVEIQVQNARQCNKFSSHK